MQELGWQMVQGQLRYPLILSFFRFMLGKKNSLKLALSGFRGKLSHCFPAPQNTSEHTHQVLPGGSGEAISPRCSWQKCFQLPELLQHISALACSTYSLCHLLARTAIVPCYCRLPRRCFGITRPTSVEKHFFDVISIFLAHGTL